MAMNMIVATDSRVLGLDDFFQFMIIFSLILFHLFWLGVGPFPQSKNKYRARFKNWNLSNQTSTCFKRVVLFDLKFCGE